MASSALEITVVVDPRKWDMAVGRKFLCPHCGDMEWDELDVDWVARTGCVSVEKRMNCPICDGDFVVRVEFTLKHYVERVGDGE
jgi:transcription elongation factor Elf1